jgi:uncharacterized protein YndB with AHSA1/START domain
LDALLKPAELFVTRDIKAPRERVFAAWTDPKMAARWWAPRDCEPLGCEMDVRPGGTWTRSMRVPDGTVITKYGVYREVTAPERLVFTYATRYADGRLDPETLVTVTFIDRGGETRLTLRHVGFPKEPLRDSHHGGWSSCLERFAAFLAGS